LPEGKTVDPYNGKDSLSNHKVISAQKGYERIKISMDGT
jgi:hypothetical protein